MLPAGDAPGVDVVVGHHVVTPEQYAVQRAGVVEQALPRVGIDQPVDQCVDGRVFQTEVVAAAGVVGTARMPVFTLFVAR